MEWVLLLVVLITVFVHLSRQKYIRVYISLICLWCKFKRLKKDYEKLKQIYQDSKKP